MNKDFEHYWSLIEQSGQPKVTKEVAKRVWDTAYPKPLPGQTVEVVKDEAQEDFEKFWDGYCSIPIELRAEDCEKDIAWRAWREAIRIAQQPQHKVTFCFPGSDKPTQG